MFRFLFLLFLLFVSHSVYATTTNISHEEMTQDLSSLIMARSNIDSLSGTGRTYVAFSRKYLRDLEGFSKKYINPFHVFSLRPTVDRSTLYRFRIQQYPLSCEIAALQIILKSLNIQVSENDILSNIPHFAFVYATGGIWGDPEQEFVGYYTGGQTKQTGYGVYEKPLADYAKNYDLKTEIINQNIYSGTLDPDIHLSLLLKLLDAKNTHILLWGDWCTDSQGEDGVLSKGGRWILQLFPLPARNNCTRSSDLRILKWVTPENKEIVGLSGEHAFVLLGYIGTPQAPSHIIVWDTYTGRHIYSYTEWMRKWSLLQYRSLIISRSN